MNDARAAVGSPLVTVIIAAYNRSRRIEPTLRSVQAQTLANFEVWVVGDACTDDTGDVVAALGDARFHWHNRPSNSGSQAAPNNEGLERARGEFISYLGHDDLWLPWHLEILVHEIDRSGAGMVHDLVAVFHPEGKHEVLGRPPPNLDYEQHFIPPSTWLLRRAVLAQIGGWRSPDNLEVPVDMDYLARLQQQTRIICHPRLGVIKWRSNQWSAYSGSSAFPQIDWETRMRLDPFACERDALTATADSMARVQKWHRRGSLPLAWRDFRFALDGFVRALRSLPLAWFGRDRWPLKGWLVRRYQRTRRAERRVRGLDGATRD